MSDLAERIEKLRILNDQPLLCEPLTDDEAKERFLALLSEGVFPEEAARGAERTATWFRRRRNPSGANYDESFTERYDEIMAPDGEHRAAVVESARMALMKAAQTGNVRAIEKLLMAYDPDFGFLRPAAHSGDLNIENLMIVMKDLPTEILQQARDALLAKRELPVIDAR